MDSQTPPQPPSQPGVTFNIPGLRGPSGTVWNDVIAIAVAVVGILKAFGVI